MPALPNQQPKRRMSRLSIAAILLVGACGADVIVNEGRGKDAILGFASHQAAARRASETQGQPDAVGQDSSVQSNASFQKLSKKLGGQVGLAWAPVGRGGEVTSLGSFESGPAWSTIKVPIAVAVAKSADGGGSSDLQHDMRRAITASDNAAAKRLWKRLGDPDEAAAATQQVLREAGDSQTEVQSQVTRSEFSAYGQTDWSLENQARFAAGLTCLPEAEPVLDLMGDVVSSQRWGAGNVGASTRVKGGWGPNESGEYLVRQMAIMTLAGGEQVAVAMASAPEDGSFEAGTRDLTKLAEWASENITDVTETSC